MTNKLTRVAKYGEVFTPMHVVEDMCDLLDPDIWSDEGVTLFEPTCGDGNIVIVLLRRRLLAIYTKAKHAGHPDPKGYAVANALSGLVAIDILADNVEKTRQRIINVINNGWVQQSEKGKLAFVNMLVNRNIHMNEVLSCLQDDPAKAEQKAKKTKIGYEWFKKHGHKPISTLLQGKVTIDIFQEAKRE